MKRMWMLIAAALLALQTYAQSAIEEKAKAMKLGAPAGAEKAFAGGTMRMYKNAAVYSSPAGTYVVAGPFWKKYKEMGAETGQLGLPVSDERQLPEGGRQMLFERGVITVPRSGAAQVLSLPGATFANDSITLSPGSATIRQLPGSVLLGLQGPAGVRDLEAVCLCMDQGRPRGLAGCPRPEVVTRQPIFLKCNPGRCFSCVLNLRTTPIFTP